MCSFSIPYLKPDDLQLPAFSALHARERLAGTRDRRGNHPTALLSLVQLDLERNFV